MAANSLSQAYQLEQARSTILLRSLSTIEAAVEQRHSVLPRSSCSYVQASVRNQPIALAAARPWQDHPGISPEVSSTMPGESPGWINPAFSRLHNHARRNSIFDRLGRIETFKLFKTISASTAPPPRQPLNCTEACVRSLQANWDRSSWCF